MMMDNSAGAIVSAETARKKYIGRRSRSTGHEMLSPVNWMPLVPEYLFNEWATTPRTAMEANRMKRLRVADKNLGHFGKGALCPIRIRGPASEPRRWLRRREVCGFSAIEKTTKRRRDLVATRFLSRALMTNGGRLVEAGAPIIKGACLMKTGSYDECRIHISCGAFCGEWLFGGSRANMMLSSVLRAKCRFMRIETCREALRVRDMVG